MKQILVAMDNFEALEYIKSINNLVVYDKDISYKDGVIEYLSKNKVDYILTKDTLEGKMTKEIYVKQIKLLAPESKIIIFVEELDEIYKSFLFANEVFNIIEQKHITKELLKEAIEDESNKVIYKISDVEKNKNNILNEDAFSDIKYNKQNINFKVVAKQTFAVFGTSGAGKSYISNIISNIVGIKLGLKTLLIDFDLQNGSADIYSNLNGENNGLSEIVNEIDNNNFSSKTFDKHIYKGNFKNNVSYITNNIGLFECQNKFSARYYNQILSQAKKNYAAVVLDTPNSIFLDVTNFNLSNADTIIFVINPNYISIRQALKYLDLIVNVWNIQKEKIFLVVNKIKKNSLSTKQIESLMPGIKVKLEIMENQNIENILNGLNNITIDGIENLNNLYNIFSKDIIEEKQINNKVFNILNRLKEKIGVKQ